MDVEVGEKEEKHVEQDVAVLRGTRVVNVATNDNLRPPAVPRLLRQKEDIFREWATTAV
jgi:hypothetical protein